MSRPEYLPRFVAMLRRKSIRYRLDGDKIIIKGKRSVEINGKDANYLPPKVRVRNRGDFRSLLEELPPNWTFANEGDVDLPNLKRLPHKTRFRNAGDVFLLGLEYSGNVAEFDIGGLVYDQPSQPNKGYRPEPPSR